jgi:hypothetical protein
VKIFGALICWLRGHKIYFERLTHIDTSKSGWPTKMYYSHACKRCGKTFEHDKRVIFEGTFREMERKGGW